MKRARLLIAVIAAVLVTAVAFHHHLTALQAQQNSTRTSSAGLIGFLPSDRQNTE